MTDVLLKTLENFAAGKWSPFEYKTEDGKKIILLRNEDNYDYYDKGLIETSFNISRKKVGKNVIYVASEHEKKRRFDGVKKAFEHVRDGIYSALLNLKRVPESETKRKREYSTWQNITRRVVAPTLTAFALMAFAPKASASLGKKIYSGIYNENPSERPDPSNPYLFIGDTNGDFVINAEDLKNLSKAFGSKFGTPDYNANCDFNRDGVVDGEDLITLSMHLNEDHRFDDLNGDGVSNVANKSLETSVSESPYEQIKSDDEISYISNVIQKYVSDYDYLSLLVASKVIKKAVEDYPYNVPPMKNNNALKKTAGDHVTTVLRFLTKYDLLKDQKSQSEMEKLKKYMERNFTPDEIKRLYQLVNEDIKKLKNERDMKKIKEISESPRVDLYLSQIKKPDDDKIVDEMKQRFVEVYVNASDLGRLILDNYVFQALMKNYYNDPTLGFAILKNADPKLRAEIINHPKAFLAYISDTRSLLSLNKFSTKYWDGRKIGKLGIKDIQKKLADGEFSNMVDYSEKNFASYFKRESEINEIRKKYGNKFALEDYLFPQLLFTFDVHGGYEENGFIEFFSKYVKDYHTLLKALWDTSNKENELLEVLKKYYDNKNFSFFASDKEAAKNVILIFEQNYGLDGVDKLPYDLKGKVKQDTRSFSEQYKYDFPKVDFDKVWDTAENILTPNNGYQFTGICQNNEALVKRVFKALLLPDVAFSEWAYKHMEFTGGHVYSGIFLKDGIYTGKLLNGGKYRESLMGMSASWLDGLGDNFFGEITNSEGGSFVSPYIIVWVNDHNLISQDPSLKLILDAVNSDPEIRKAWNEFTGNYIPISILSWMIKQGTRFSMFST